MKKVIGVTLISAVAAIAGCSTDADVASRNLSRAADMFEIDRRIVFYNTWKGEYLLSIEGKCSIETGNRVAVTCKTGPSEFKKHYLALSGNVTYFSEQVKAKSVSAYRYRVIFKPESIVPDIDLRTSAKQP